MLTQHSVQFDKAGAATGNTLMCAPDCALLQAKRDQFEAFTLLMCAASAGNKAALQYLLRAGLAWLSNYLTSWLGTYAGYQAYHACTDASLSVLARRGLSNYRF